MYSMTITIFLLITRFRPFPCLLKFLFFSLRENCHFFHFLFSLLCFLFKKTNVSILLISFVCLFPSSSKMILLEFFDFQANTEKHDSKFDLILHVVYCINVSSECIYVQMSDGLETLDVHEPVRWIILQSTLCIQLSIDWSLVFMSRNPSSIEMHGCI